MSFFTSSVPILPAPELATSSSDPNVEAPAIAHPVGLEFSFGLANLCICQRHFPSKVRRFGKCPQGEKKVPPEIPPSALGSHSAPSDSKREEILCNQLIERWYRTL